MRPQKRWLGNIQNSNPKCLLFFLHTPHNICLSLTTFLSLWKLCLWKYVLTSEIQENKEYLKVRQARYNKNEQKLQTERMSAE